jgi:hypothetical protein
METGTTLAELGNTVFCVDIDENKVERMKQGIVPIYEPGLEEMFTRNIQAKRLFFTTEIKEALDQSDVIYLALPTPPGGDGSADLSFVLSVANQIGEMMTNYKVIVNNRYEGMIFHSEVFENLKIGDKKRAYVKNVREDNKLDISLQKIGQKIVDDKVFEVLEKNGGKLNFTYKSEAEDIKEVFGISKKSFKASLNGFKNLRFCP